jgi:hypothetical protein
MKMLLSGMAGRAVVVGIACLYGRRPMQSRLSHITGGMSVPAIDAGGVCSSKEMPVMGAE